jgi:N-acetylmuramoyl-L-alanine amidase
MQINRNNQIVIDEEKEFNFQQIPAHPLNFDANPDHKLTDPNFIIMHYTGGIKMESTINAFQDAPRDASSGACAHLLIGRDGSVVQFLRFDQIAYHTGFSWWEQQSQLNNCSIGIELDNAGQLVRNNNKWQPRHMDDITIPDDEVQRSEYWKAPLPPGNRADPDYTSQLPGFQKFTDVQLATALKIVQALVKRYPSIREILGHDQINIANRMDPGPLMPMKEWRKNLFVREEPVIVEYVINKQTSLFTNVDGKLPNTDQSTFDKPLPTNSVVKIISNDEGGLTKVAVIKSTVKGTGWVRTNSLEALPKQNKKKNEKVDNQRRTTLSQPFFKAGERPPTLMINGGQVFPVGIRVRIQIFDGEWALVAMLDRINGRGEVDNDHGMGGLEGWMPRESVSRKDD